MRGTLENLGLRKNQVKSLGHLLPLNSFFCIIFFLDCYKWISDLLKTKNNSLAVGMKGKLLEEASFGEKKILVFFLATNILFFSLLFFSSLLLLG